MLFTIAVVAAAATSVQPLAEEYLAQLWKDSPTTASQVGYHDGGVDGHLDDASADARKRRGRWLHDFDQRLSALSKGLPAEDAADVALLQSAVALELSDLESLRPFARRCDTPLDSLGSVFFFMAARPYAAPQRRAADIVSRLGEVPRYLTQIQASLEENVPIFREAAKDDGEGLIDYLEHELPARFTGKDKASVEAAVPPAVAAIKRYLAYLDHELAAKQAATFRAGAGPYERRFRPYLQTDLGPKEVLAAAQRRFDDVRREMAVVAKKIVPSGNVKEALDKVAQDHPKPEALFATVKADLARARAFVVEKHLLTLPAHDNLEVIETPAFMRSQLGVAAFDGAPPLQPQLGAFYYVTPFPKGWPAAKIDSKLREYNRFMLELLTFHEAMPGHYVQFEHANQVQPTWRRTLRWVLGAGSYIEGWAVYAQNMLVAEGYLGGDPRLKIQALKMDLRAAANAILDIKLQTGDFSDEAALHLMIDEGFQERSEAELKLRRAKLSVTQLCSYFVGDEAWRSIRAAADKQADGKLDLRAFHDRALSFGAVTLPSLRILLLAH